MSSSIALPLEIVPCLLLPLMCSSSHKKGLRYRNTSLLRQPPLQHSPSTMAYACSPLCPSSSLWYPSSSKLIFRIHILEHPRSTQTKLNLM